MDLEEAEVFDMNRHVEEPEYHPRSHLKIDESSKVSKAIDPKRERYPFCIVWSPLGPQLPFVRNGPADAMSVSNERSGFHNGSAVAPIRVRALRSGFFLRSVWPVLEGWSEYLL